jgi:hypothetical protein
MDAACKKGPFKDKCAYRDINKVDAKAMIDIAASSVQPSQAKPRNLPAAAGSPKGGPMTLLTQHLHLQQCGGQQVNGSGLQYSRAPHTPPRSEKTQQHKLQTHSTPPHFLLSNSSNPLPCCQPQAQLYQLTKCNQASLQSNCNTVTLICIQTTLGWVLVPNARQQSKQAPDPYSCGWPQSKTIQAWTRVFHSWVTVAAPAGPRMSTPVQPTSDTIVNASATNINCLRCSCKRR